MNKRNKTFARLEESPFCGVAGSTFLHSGPPSRVKAQTRHSEHAQAPLARGREGKSLRGEAGGGGGGCWGCVVSRGHFSWVSEYKIGELLITYSFLLSKLSGFCSYCACASSYNAIVLMDRVDFTRAFGDLRITIDFLGAR